MKLHEKVEWVKMPFDFQLIWLPIPFICSMASSNLASLWFHSASLCKTRMRKKKKNSNNKALSKEFSLLCILHIVFILPSFSKDNHAAYTSHDWQVFFFEHFVYVIPLLSGLHCFSWAISRWPYYCYPGQCRIVFHLLYPSFSLWLLEVWLWYMWCKSICVYPLGIRWVLPFWNDWLIPVFKECLSELKYVKFKFDLAYLA